jgi:hypothetical protein
MKHNLTVGKVLINFCKNDHYTALDRKLPPLVIIPDMSFKKASAVRLSGAWFAK